ncbi:DNA recombination protein RmuC [Actinomadura chokoriensis]|uniref:DNA recombination protein RmuC n=1 Tax=Actinomadura chokoriensis TaxID=454156 RepID=UPI003567C78C
MNSSEGVLMFVRTESIRFSALDTDPALIDNAADRQIFTVSTVSLIHYLRAGTFGWIQDGLMRTYGRFSILATEPTAALCNGRTSVYGGLPGS